MRGERSADAVRVVVGVREHARDPPAGHQTGLPLRRASLALTGAGEGPTAVRVPR
jgi:hypothetical protein